MDDNKTRGSRHGVNLPALGGRKRRSMISTMVDPSRSCKAANNRRSALLQCHRGARTNARTVYERGVLLYEAPRRSAAMGREARPPHNQADRP